MFERISKPAWTRRTRWTPLLQTQREFQRTLSKERARVDRDESCFGLIILRLTDLHGARGQTVQLAKILHRRLREPDEKGHLGLGRIGVMLPATGLMASEFVLDDLVELAAASGLSIEGEAFVYPDQDDRSSGKPRSDKEEKIPSVSKTKETGSIPSKPQPQTTSFFLAAEPRWKRALDILGAGVGLTLSSPLLLTFAALIKATSPGPIIFKQKRTGFLGKEFEIYKLRTMVSNAEELKSSLAESNERDGPAFKMRNDPRITKLGRFLRSTGLDELPQLFNVLRGDMSLVGPRPLPVDEAAQCEPWQKRRQAVKPGLTCFWQLAKSRKMTFAEWMRLDLRYARKVSFGLDLRLIFKTFASVILGRVGH